MLTVTLRFPERALAMNTHNLKHIIRKRCISRLFLPAAVLAAVILLAIVNPFENRSKSVNITELSRTEQLLAENTGYVSLTPEVLYYSGVDYRINNKVKARIFYTIENDVCYYFIISCGVLPEKYDTLENFSLSARLINDEELLNKITRSISYELDFSIDGIRNYSSPVIISQYHLLHGFTTFYLATLSVIGIISALHVIAVVFVAVMPGFSRTVVRLRKYGNRKTLFRLACDEFAVSKATARKNVYITDSFLISISPINVDIIPLENIVWIYNNNVIHKSNGKAKMFFQLCIVTDCKKLYKIHRVTQKTAERITDVIQSRFPEIMVGHDN